MTKNPGWASPYFAPYVDMTLNPTPELSEMWNERGMKQKFANLAFVNANTKTGETAWGGIADFTIGSVGEKKIRESISTFQADGGKVAISLGGQTAGNASPGGTLANYYLDNGKSTDDLADAYKNIYDVYKPSRLDFDIEGASSLEKKYVDFRSQALAKFQKSLDSKDDVEL